MRHLRMPVCPPTFWSKSLSLSLSLVCHPQLSPLPTHLVVTPLWSPSAGGSSDVSRKRDLCHCCVRPAPQNGECPLEAPVSLGSPKGLLSLIRGEEGKSHHFLPLWSACSGNVPREHAQRKASPQGLHQPVRTLQHTITHLVP